MKFVFIAAEKALYPVRSALRRCSRSRGAATTRGSAAPRRPRRSADARLAAGDHGGQAFAAVAHTAARASTASCEHTGIRVGKKRIERLMRENGLVARQKRRFVHTTDSRHEHPIAPNLLDRQFDARRANEAWVGDVTYIPTGAGLVVPGRAARPLLATGCRMGNERRQRP